MAAVRFAMNVCHRCGDDFIQASVTVESEKANILFIFILSSNSFLIVSTNSANRYAAHNSNLASDTFFSGATRDFAHTNVTVVGLFSKEPTRRYNTAP